MNPQEPAEPEDRGAEPVPVDELLGLRRQADSRSALRQELLTQTTSLIRRGRRAKRAMLATMLAGCYLAGWATERFLVSPRDAGSAEPRLSNDAAERKIPPIETQPITKKKQRPARPTKQLVERTERQDRASKQRQDRASKQRAAPAPRSRYQALRARADRHLRYNGNIELAARLYANSLRDATPEELALSADDSWLLLALKAERSTQTETEEAQDDTNPTQPNNG